MKNKLEKSELIQILENAIQGFPPSVREIPRLLETRDSEAIRMIQSTAKKVREKNFGRQIYLYGFIYFSTYCRNHCTFCFYRKQNLESPRYRKSVGEVIDIASRLQDSGTHLIDLTMGEDPIFHNNANFDAIYQIIEGVKSKTGLPLMISPGVVPDNILLTFAKLGVDWLALYQETHNRSLYKKLRPGQGFDERIKKRNLARQAGMLVEDGILIGVGETVKDRTNAFMAMKKSHVNQARVMSFIPQKYTPLSDMESPSRKIECLCIAIMRLIMQDRLIPASLDVDGIQGLKMRLDSGANVVTSIIPPASGLAGVSQGSLDIEEGLRDVTEVTKIITALGLQTASFEDYSSWISLERDRKRMENHPNENMYCGRTAPGPGSDIPCPTSSL